MATKRVKVLDRAALVEASTVGHASRSAYEVDFLHLGVPLSECLCAAPGRVSLEFLENLRIPGYDQAPVPVPGSRIGWRLVSRARLEELHESATPLGQDLSHYEPDDVAEVDGVHIGLPELLRLFLSRRATLVYAREALSTGEPEEGWDVPETSWTELSVLGLLTISDLNRREVRKAAYELLLDLETALGELVERRFKDSWDWMRHLGEPAQVRLLGYWELSRKRGIDTQPLESAMLNELLTVVSRTEVLRKAIAIPSDKEMDRVARKIGDLRNRVMHPVRPFALNADDVVKMLDAVQAALHIQEQLRKVVEA